MWIQIGSRKLIPLVISKHKSCPFLGRNINKESMASPTSTAPLKNYKKLNKHTLWHDWFLWTDAFGWSQSHHHVSFQFDICHHQRMSWQSRLATAFLLINYPEKTSHVYSGSHVIKNWFACYPSFSIIKIINK